MAERFDQESEIPTGPSNRKELIMVRPRDSALEGGNRRLSIWACVKSAHRRSSQLETRIPIS